MTREEQVSIILERRVENFFPNKGEVIKRLSSDKVLTFYCGIDPTSPQIHLGHTVQFLLLKELAKLKHRVIILIGGFTAQIGDPTDKDAARAQLTWEQVEENSKNYEGQIKKIFEDVPFELRNNEKWLANLKLEDVIKLASRVTVQQMLARDMFQVRLKKEKPIFVHEFLYPLMQGYDSVEMQVDGEVGGSDQTFNMLVGRELEKELLGKDKMILTTKLLVDANTDKKMSKSEGAIIGLDDSPQEIRRKVLNYISDQMIKTVFELCTEKNQDWIDQKSKEDPRAFKELLADELVRMYQGELAIEESRTSIRVTGEGTTLKNFLVKSGAASTMSESQRLIKKGAVSVLGTKQEDWNYKVKKGEEIQVGKGKRYSVD